MEVKKHYKLFKAGKSWCTMAITVAALTVGFMTTNSVVHADTTTNDTQTTLTTDKATTVSQVNSQATTQTNANSNQQKNNVDYQTTVNDGHLDSASVDSSNQSINFSG